MKRQRMLIFVLCVLALTLFLTFCTNQSDPIEELMVTKPDSVQRVFLAFQPLTEAVDIEPQVLEPFQREGFAVIEWGGCEVLSSSF